MVYSFSLRLPSRDTEMRRTLLVVIFALLPVLLAGMLALWPPLMNGAGSDQSVAIIVNPANPVENCSFEDLRKIFMGEKSHWPNGAAHHAGHARSCAARAQSRTARDL